MSYVDRVRKQNRRHRVVKKWQQVRHRRIIALMVNEAARIDITRRGDTETIVNIVRVGVVDRVDRVMTMRRGEADRHLRRVRTRRSQDVIVTRV